MVWFQIALKNGCPQDWGLIEFLGEDEAEKTQQSLNGYILHGRRIRIAYYIPGVRAINLYLKLLNDGVRIRSQNNHCGGDNILASFEMPGSRMDFIQSGSLWVCWWRRLRRPGFIRLQVLKRKLFPFVEEDSKRMLLTMA